MSDPESKRDNDADTDINQLRIQPNQVYRISLRSAYFTLSPIKGILLLLSVV